MSILHSSASGKELGLVPAMRDANTPIRLILRADAALLLGNLGHGQLVRTF